MDLGEFITLAAGLVLLAIALQNELQWRRRLQNRSIVKGQVVDLVPDEDGNCYAEIEFNIGAECKRFQSTYSFTRTPYIGEAVDVMTNESGTDAEHYTVKTRWTFTLIPFAVGLTVIAIAFV